MIANWNGINNWLNFEPPISICEYTWTILTTNTLACVWHHWIHWFQHAAYSQRCYLDHENNKEHLHELVGGIEHIWKPRTRVYLASNSKETNLNHFGLLNHVKPHVCWISIRHVRLMATSHENNAGFHQPIPRGSILGSEMMMKCWNIANWEYQFVSLKLESSHDKWSKLGGHPSWNKVN